MSKTQRAIQRRGLNAQSRALNAVLSSIYTPWTFPADFGRIIYLFLATFAAGFGYLAWRQVSEREANRTARILASPEIESKEEGCDG